VTDKFKKIEKNISDLGNTITELADKVEPLINFRNLEKQIEKLKDVVPTAENIEKMTGKEGDTCMHGNAWHSECSECNEMDRCHCLITRELIEEYPDDADLGKEIRELYNSYTGDSDKTEE